LAQEALQGIRIVEFGIFQLAPVATALLGDLGAEVIKIENPRGGDPSRYPQPVEDLPAPDAPPSLWFDQFNHNKKSVAVDPNTERGREILYKLVQTADVFITNFDPRFVERVKADYESLREINPRLIYVQCSGYGIHGPDKYKPGFDYAAFWARSGLMDRIAEPGGIPRAQRPGMGDNMASLAVGGAVGTALFVRERTGVGQKIDFSLYHFGVWALAFDTLAALHMGRQIRQTDRKIVTNALWNCYKTKDERWIMLVMPQTDRYWPQFCRAIGKPEWENDPRFDSHLKRTQENLTLIPALDEIMATKTAGEWETIAQEFDLIFGRIQTPLEVVKDPQTWENNFFAEADHPSGVKVNFVRSPVQYSEMPATIKSCGPELGQNTEELLLELDYTWDDIADLKSQGVIL